VPKLLVAIRRLPQRKTLTVRPQGVSSSLQFTPYRRMACWRTPLRQHLRDSSCRLSYPLHSRRRITCTGTLHDVREHGSQLWRLFSSAGRPPPGARTRSAGTESSRATVPHLQPLRLHVGRGLSGLDVRRGHHHVQAALQVERRLPDHCS
jgi:hypothetical protein